MISWSKSPDVVVVGAGVIGCSIAYWLSKAGVHVLLVEKDHVGSGASGMAAAMLEGFNFQNTSTDDPLTKLVGSGIRLHKKLSVTLPEESGLDTGYCETPSIVPAFTSKESSFLKAALEDKPPSGEWLEGQALSNFEPLLTRTVMGAVASKQGQVIANKFVMALAKAGTHYGVKTLNSEVMGLVKSKKRLSGIKLLNGDIIPSNCVVLAMGPWSKNTTNWTGFNIPIYPVKGQLLELHAPDQKPRGAIIYDGMYVVQKSDGTVIAGATEEHQSGFNTNPTNAGRDYIIKHITKLAPSLSNAKITKHLVGLRPRSKDGMPAIGPIPDWDGLHIASGHFRSGILLGPISGKIMSDFITTGHGSTFLEYFSPARWTH